MNKKVFVGTVILDENNEVNKALGIIENMHTGETTWVNTENLSDKAVKILLEQSQKKLQKEYLRVIEHVSSQKELSKEPTQVIEYVPRKDIEK